MGETLDWLTRRLGSSPENLNPFLARCMRSGGQVGFCGCGTKALRFTRFTLRYPEAQDLRCPERQRPAAMRSMQQKMRSSNALWHLSC
jgi:hypothetical protein